MRRRDRLALSVCLLARCAGGGVAGRTEQLATPVRWSYLSGVSGAAICGLCPITKYMYPALNAGLLEASPSLYGRSSCVIPMAVSASLRAFTPGLSILPGMTPRYTPYSLLMWLRTLNVSHAPPRPLHRSHQQDRPTLGPS